MLSTIIAVILEKYELYLYSTEQHFYNLLIASTAELKVSSIFLFIIFGIFTSFTPCFISVVPLSIAYLSVNDSSYSGKIIFGLGLTSSTLCLMFLINLLSYKYANYINRLPIFSAVILIMMSLNLLEIIDTSLLSSFLNRYLNYKRNNIKVSLNYSNYLSGFIIGLNMLPCSSSIIFIISFWLLNSINLLLSYFYLLLFSFAYILSMITIVNVSFRYTELYFISNIWNKIVPLCGFIMLMISLLNILEKLFI